MKRNLKSHPLIKAALLLALGLFMQHDGIPSRGDRQAYERYLLKLFSSLPGSGVRSGKEPVAETDPGPGHGRETLPGGGKGTGPGHGRETLPGGDTETGPEAELGPEFAALREYLMTMDPKPGVSLRRPG